MSMIDTSVKKPVTISMVILAVMILGVVSLSRLSVDFFPNIEMPTLAVATSYSGAGPKEVEKSVTRIVEGAVGSVNNIDYIQSSSYEGSSVVQVNFKYGTDLDAAASDVREKLDLIRDRLPDDAGQPTVFKFSPAMMPIMSFSLSGSEDQAFLYDLADTQIKKKLEQVPGVASVNLAGGLEREVHVDISKNRLQAYGLDLQNITAMLYLENQNIAGGYTYEGVYKYTLRTAGEFRDLDDVKNVIISIKNGVPVKLRDIADVTYGYSDESSIVRLNGSPAIMFFIQKEAGLNTVSVAREAQKQVDELNATLPPGISLRKIFDFSKDINASIGSVGAAALWGAAFAVLVLLLYLWDWRSMLIIGVSIPTSIIVTFVLMYFLKVNLNIISLSGLALGVGMMVDSSIVVLENIYYHRRHGEGRYSGAINGTKEVMLAITASTITTVGVFLPIVFVEGFTGQLFRDLALTVSISLLASLVVSITVIPMLTARIKRLEENRFLKKVEIFTTNLLDRIDQFYGRVLERALRHKKAIVFSTVGVVLVVGIFLLVVIGKEGFPQVDEGRFSVNVEFPVGTRVDYTDRVTKSIEREIVKIAGENLENMNTQIRGGGLFARMQGTADYKSRIRVNLVPKEKRHVNQDVIIEKIRQMAKRYPAKIFVSAEGASRMGMSSTPVQIEIRGDNLETADRLAQQIVAVISKVDGVREPKIDRDDALPELQISINRNLASRVGLNAQNIASAIKTGFGGQVATVMRSKDGVDIDVIVRLQEEDRMSIQDIEALSLPTPTGKLVPLASIINEDKTYGPTAIGRKDAIRILNVTADVFGRAPNKVVEDIRRQIDKDIYKPKGFTISYGGSYKDMQDSFKQIAMAFLLSIILVYAIMASQFESLIAPFIIMFCVPFGAVGAMIFLVITGSTLSIVSAAGIVVLVGIVINNGIVLVDYINQLNAKGIPIDEAAKQAGMRRLRPVSMTTLTTILGMLPMALGLGQGGELYSPMAIAILGGLLISTIFTLVVVPTAYAAIRKRFPLKIHSDEEDINGKAVKA